MFTHERLEAYRHGLAFYKIARQVRLQLPAGLGDLRDELFRASGSICRNTAEGANERTYAQKRRYFYIALGSTGECACILDQIEIEGAAPAELLAAGRAELNTAAALLVGLVR